MATIDINNNNNLHEAKPQWLKIESPFLRQLSDLKKLTLRQLACSLMCCDKSKKTFCVTLTWLSKVGQEKKSTLMKATRLLSKL